MLGYISTIQNFINTPPTSILQYLMSTYSEATPSQVRSWEVLIDDIRNSKTFHNIPASSIICLELSLFVENMSVDLAIAGSTPTGENVVFLIESKQWGDDYILSHPFSSYRESGGLLHPQVQVHHHFLSLKDYIKIEPEISHIQPFVYMKNASIDGCNHLQKINPDLTSLSIPIFNDIDSIFEIISDNLSFKTSLSVKSIQEASYSPSVSIIDAMSAIVTREVPFILTNEQEAALLKILDYISQGKRIIRINGGAGSGKTAILLNIYVRMLRKGNCYLPLFVSGAQNTHLYKSLYPEVSGSFNFTFSLRSTVRNLRDRTPVILLDEAQHNKAGIISEMLSNPRTILILSYDDWQTINADNALHEINSFCSLDEFASIDLNNSVRFNGSQLFESNVKSYLLSTKTPTPDDRYDFRVINSFEELRLQTDHLIKTYPEYEVALMGLLSDDDHEMAKSSNGFLTVKWSHKAETEWIPYIKEKNYLSRYDGSLWVGTWWMPGLDVDYGIVIVGDDACLTSSGFKGIARHSRNYLMIISIAEQLGLPERLTKTNSSNSSKVEGILNYLELPQNRHLKDTFDQTFTIYLRNMYYVMMTRGRKGCFVYFKNKHV